MMEGRGNADLNFIQIASTLIALGMVSVAAIGLLGVVSSSPLLIALLLVVVVLLSFMIVFLSFTLGVWAA